MSRNGTVVDDAPPLGNLRFHHPESFLNAIEGTAEVDVHHVLPLRQGQVFQRDAWGIHTRVIEDHINPAKFLDDGGKQGFDGLGV